MISKEDRLFLELAVRRGATSKKDAEVAREKAEARDLPVLEVLLAKKMIALSLAQEVQQGLFALSFTCSRCRAIDFREIDEPERAGRLCEKCDPPRARPTPPPVAAPLPSPTAAALPPPVPVASAASRVPLPAEAPWPPRDDAPLPFQAKLNVDTVQWSKAIMRQAAEDARAEAAARSAGATGAGAPQAFAPAPRKEPRRSTSRLAPVGGENRVEHFLHRMFAQGPDAPWTERWPSFEFDPWDGGAYEDGTGDQLDAQELRKIAATAAGAELRKVLRCGNENVLVAVLDNPALKIEDVIRLAGSPKASARVLADIARRRNWSGDQQLARELCLNPKTPYHASRSLVARLATPVLREILASPFVPPALAKDVLQALDKKRTRKL